MSDTNLVFRRFQSLCQHAGPARCALAGQGPVAAPRATVCRSDRLPFDTDFDKPVQTPVEEP